MALQGRRGFRYLIYMISIKGRAGAVLGVEESKIKSATQLLSLRGLLQNRKGTSEVSLHS